MTTIHDTLLLCKRLNSLTQKVNDQINAELVILLRHICQVDLSNEPKPFVQNVASFVMSINIEYKFKYGTVSVVAKENSIDVSFFFIMSKCKDIYIPFQSNRCNVDVDKNLKFKQATFNYSLNIVKTNNVMNTKLQTRHSGRYVGSVLVTDPRYATIHIQRVMDKQLQLSTLVSYKNYRAKNGDSIELTAGELAPCYFQPNKEFEDFFVEFMRTFSSKSQQFDSVFIDYPTHQHFMDDKQYAINFFNLLSKQYFSSFDLIESNLLLIDMQTI